MSTCRRFVLESLASVMIDRRALSAESCHFTFVSSRDVVDASRHADC